MTKSKAKTPKTQRPGIDIKSFLELINPMILLNKATEDKKFDTRIVEKNIVRGRIKTEDHDKHVSSLPDDRANAEWVKWDEFAIDSRK